MSEELSTKHSILGVPLILFTEISERLGIEDECEIWCKSSAYRGRKLDPGSRFSGFPGAIGYRNPHDTCHVFMLWARIPLREDKDTVFEPEPVLEVRAQARSIGVTTFSPDGQRESMRERASISCRDVDLETRCGLLVGMIVARASQLVLDPACVKRSFWLESPSVGPWA